MSRNVLTMVLALAAVGMVSAAALGQQKPSAKQDVRRTPVVLAVQKVADAVANISTERIVVRPVIQPHSDTSPFGGPNDAFEGMFNDFFGRLRYVKERVENPLGSGALIDPDGYVVTNEHVVRRATSLKITLYGDKKTYQAKLVSADPTTDIAILKIASDKPFHYIRIGTSADLMLGETVIAMGNPLGFATSIAVGVVSAMDREIKAGGTQYAGLIQTDAAINPGNSGGPLLNIAGELIGINAAIVASAEGLGFAIPVDKVKRTLTSLFRLEETSKMRVGVEVDETSGEVVVRTVEANSPALQAGVRVGDAVTALDTEPIDSAFSFWKHLAKRNAGDTIQFGLRRGRQPLTVSLVAAPAPKPAGEQLAESKFGLVVVALTPSLAETHRLSVGEGIYVEKVQKSSPAHRAGIQPGDVIVQVAGKRLRTMEELGALLKQVRAGELVDVTVVRGEYIGYARMSSRS